MLLLISDEDNNGTQLWRNFVEKLPKDRLGMRVRMDEGLIEYNAKLVCRNAGKSRQWFVEFLDEEKMTLFILENS